MATPTKPMTVEEFWEQYAGKPYELVRGRVVEVSPSSVDDSEIAMIIAAALLIFIRKHGIKGRVAGADGGFYLSSEDLRSPDVAYIGPDNAAKVPAEKFAPFAPDLAVEVVSPGNTIKEMRDKVKLYLDAGTQQVWLVYPDSAEVDVHYPDGTAKTFTRDDTLDGGTVLPGLNLAVADLFPAQESDEGTAS